MTEAVTNFLKNEPSNNLHLHYGIRFSRYENSKKFADTIVVKEVEKYQRKRTIPLTWKGHTNNTCYLQ